ncbi:hypothetical protein KCP69_13185 [Salmonella enterica subsp. enterica]|nr:hypothetical protein KCP69_13185 [Salmonella enterica subsp. enterica]
MVFAARAMANTPLDTLILGWYVRRAGDGRVIARYWFSLSYGAKTGS